MDDEADKSVRQSTERTLALLETSSEIVLSLLALAPDQAGGAFAARMCLPPDGDYCRDPMSVQALLRPGEAILTVPPAAPGEMWRGRLVLQRTAPGPGGAARPYVEPLGVEVYSKTEAGAAAAALVAGRQAQAAALAALVHAVPFLAARTHLDRACLDLRKPL